MKLNRRRFIEIAGLTAAAVVMSTTASYTLAADASAGPLKIGVIGSGRIGSTLGGVWIKAGHEVMFPSLDIEHDRKLAASLGPKAKAGTPREAAAFGEVLLMAVPYRAMPAVGKDLGALVKGKIIVDASNAIAPRDGEIVDWVREKGGAGLASAELLPGARIVRAFNAIGYAKMGAASENPGHGIGMPIAGDDKAAIAVASRLVREIGYEPVLVGSLAAMGKYLTPRTPLAGEHTPEEIRSIAATLK